jgi:hypothetical protein
MDVSYKSECEKVDISRRALKGNLEGTALSASSNVKVIFKPANVSVVLAVESYTAMRYHGQ